MNLLNQKRERQNQTRIPAYSLNYWDLRALSNKDRDIILLEDRKRKSKIKQ